MFAWLRIYFEKSPHAKFQIVALFLSLLLLSASQAMLVVLFGPVLKVIVSLNASATGKLVLSDYLPTSYVNALYPFWSHWTIERADAVVIFPIFFLAVVVVRTISSYAYQYFSLKFSISLGTILRDQALKNLLLKSFQEVASKSVGEWMSILVHDVFLLQRIVADIYVGMSKEIAMVFAAVVGLTIISPIYGFTLLGLIPIVLIALRRQALRIQYFAEWWQSQIRRMATHIIELRKRLPWVVVNNGVEMERAKFGDICLEYFTAMKSSLVVRATFASGVEFVGFLGIAFVLKASFSGEMHSDLSFQGPYVLALLGALGLIVRPLRAIGEYWSRFAEIEGSLKPLTQLILDKDLTEKNFPSIAPKPSVFQSSASEILFENCNIDYRPSGHEFVSSAKIHLKSAQVEIRKLKIEFPKMYAIIGESGSGKSSFLKVLGGLIQPLHFEIHSKEFSTLEEIQRVTHYVGQIPFLFDGSLEENLRYGTSEVDELHKKSEITNRPGESQSLAFQSSSELSDLLLKVGLQNSGDRAGQDLLNRSLKTFEGGLSGGEKQRLMIARSFLFRKNIYCYDEVTSGLDDASEIDMLNLIREKIISSLGGAALVVTHRRKNLHLFDEIIYFDQGQFMGQGTYAELESRFKLSEKYE